MNRKINYVSKITGVKTYSFQCHDQIHTGTIKTRLKKGLSIDGICDNKSFPEWKLEVQADFIFRKLLSNKQEIYETAIEMLESSVAVDTHIQDKKQKIENLIKYTFTVYFTYPEKLLKRKLNLIIKTFMNLKKKSN